MIREIVVVESTADTREWITDFFLGKGYEVRPFAAIPPALSYIDQHPSRANVALTEISQPEKNVPTLVNFTRGRNLPLVLLAMTDRLPRNPFQIIRYGLKSLFQKPLNIEAVHTTMKTSVRERECRPGIHCEYYGFLSDTCIQSGFRSHLETRLREYGFDPKKANTIILAVDEIFTNAVIHGNYGMGSRKDDPDNWDETYKGVQTAIENPGSWESRRYLPRIQKKVYVDLKFLHRNVLITVRDEGEGFDWRPHFEVDAASVRPDISGFGISIARRVMAEVLYNGTGNEVTMYATA
ncbi:MAG: ATP-binding protein [Planctomycetota bacterium]|jgi:anti-sigma regulatory factor (Ser/Thr protein kinase)